MRIAVITMVYKSYGLLQRWFDHYSELVGADALVVVSHGNDPEHRRIAKDASFIGIPREDTDRFEQRRNMMLSGVLNGLSEYYDVVVRVDTDEFLFVDPDLHKSLADCFESSPQGALFALGFEVFQGPNDPPLVEGQPVSLQRSICGINYMECKAVASRGEALLRFHGIATHGVSKLPTMSMPRGLYLAHLKYTDLGDLGSANIDREADTEGEADGPLASLQAYERREYRMAGRPVVDDADFHLDKMWRFFSKGFGQHRTLRKSIVVRKRRVMRPFTLPERFRGQF